MGSCMPSHRVAETICRVSFLLAGLLACWALPATAQERASNILLIHSYHQNLVWNEAIQRGVDETLQSSALPHKLFIEHLDEKRIPGEGNLAMFLDLLRTRYGAMELDLVMVSDQAALDLVVERRDELFPETPVVFCGIDHLKLDALAPHRQWLTGVGEGIDIRKNIDLAIRLNPNTKEIVALGDSSDSAEKHREVIRELAPQYADKLRFTFLMPSCLDDLQTQLASLSPDASLLYLHYHRCEDGSFLPFTQVLPMIGESSAAPTYGSWDFSVHLGLMGGFVTDGYKQGAVMARLGLRILSGDAPADIPIAESPNTYLFDADRLKRFNISMDALPPDASVLNSSPSLFKSHPRLVVAVVGLMVIFGLASLLMALYIGLRKKTLKALRESELKLEQQVVARTRELQVRTEELEEANVRLRGLDETKSTIITTVSHELRTPLTSILGFAKVTNKKFNQFAAQVTPKSGEEDQRLDDRARTIAQNLGIIEEQGFRLSRLVNDFLDLSRMESGRAVWRDEPMDMVQLLRRVAQAAAGGLDQSPDVIIDLDLPESLPTARLDADRVEQLFFNLLHNSIKFTTSGTIRLKARGVEDALVFCVTDEGVGIPRDDLPLIFDSFHQTQCATEASSGPGTGLGLSICKRIVDHYGGVVWAESEQGRGASFYVELPVT